MIRPNMATMLGFIATDAAVPQPLLERWVREAADLSFNRITVDGDTSTNDTLLLVATGASGVARRCARRRARRPRRSAMPSSRSRASWRRPSCATARARPSSSPSRSRRPAAGPKRRRSPMRSPIRRWSRPRSSPPTRTSGASSPPIGYAGIDDLDVGRIDLYLDDVHVATGGGRHPGYREEDGQRVMKQAEILVRVVLNRGAAATTVWTCDLSHDYVSINADYRS